jgi:hypothetical protein
VPPDMSVAISVLSLAISGLVAWLTLLRTGIVKMTQPTIIFFGPDGDKGTPKVFLRTLLYSSANRGCIVENMFVRLQRGESLQTFNIWVYGDRPLARGSGLFVGPQGIACNHHFLLPKNGSTFQFLEGDYTVTVYATLVGRKNALQLQEIKVALPEKDASAMKSRGAGTYFDWGPDSSRYHTHVDDPPKRFSEEKILGEVMKAAGLNEE